MGWNQLPGHTRGSTWEHAHMYTSHVPHTTHTTYHTHPETAHHSQVLSKWAFLTLPKSQPWC